MGSIISRLIHFITSFFTFGDDNRFHVNVGFMSFGPYSQAAQVTSVRTQLKTALCCEVPRPRFGGTLVYDFPGLFSLQADRHRNTDLWQRGLSYGFNGVLFVELKTDKKPVKLPIVTVFGAVVERIFKITKPKINGQVESIQIVFPRESSVLKENLRQIKAKVGVEVYH